MEPMHERYPYAKSDHEKHLDTLKPEAERGNRPFLATGKLGNEAVVIWVMLAGVAVGFLTRSAIGMFAGGIGMYGLWYFFKRAFGGYFMGRTYTSSALAKWCFIGAAGGFASAFAIGLAGVHFSLLLGTILGTGAGLGYYQLGPLSKKK